MYMCAIVLRYTCMQYSKHIPRVAVVSASLLWPFPLSLPVEEVVMRSFLDSFILGWCRVVVVGWIGLIWAEGTIVQSL